MTDRPAPRNFLADAGELVQRLCETGRLSLYAAVAASGAVACAMVVFRANRYDDSLVYGFLGWNLLLAGIPFAISQWAALFPPRTNMVLATAIFFWLLFFPNAPYLITDLAHLSNPTVAPFWFDLVLLLAFAWNGLMLGFLSLLEMQHLMDRRLGRVAGWLFSVGALVLASFGIYLGRFLRWNSWDLFASPTGLLGDVAERLLHPLQYPAAYGVTAMFSVFLLFGYVLLRSLVQVRLPPSDIDALRRPSLGSGSR